MHLVTTKYELLTSETHVVYVSKQNLGDSLPGLVWILLGMGYKTIAIVSFGLVTTVITVYMCLNLIPSIDWRLN